jgi:hypothetical protein
MLTIVSFTSYGQKSCEDNCSKKKKSDATTTTQNPAPLSCKMTSVEQMKRSEELKATLFKKYDKLNESPDAIELVYADGKKYSPLLIEFINSERVCCPFYTFDLKFEPNSEKVSLIIGGSPQIKEMAKSMIN